MNYKVVKNTYQVQVYNIIEKMIVSGELKPGQKLVESSLTGILGVSRSPIREAIIKLESVGLVKNKAGSGWIVSKISSQEIIELYDLRKLLEVYSGKIGCLKCPKEIKKEIKNELNLMEKAKRVDTWRERNMRFHELIVLSCNNNKIYEVFMSTIKMLNWCSHVTEPVSLRKKESLIEHQSILDAFLLKDQELFERKISLHIDNAKKKVIRYQK